MKTVSAALDSHLQLETTSVTTCLRVERVDGKRFYFTLHDQPLEQDLGFPDGNNVYQPINSYRATSVDMDTGLNVDNLEIRGIFATTGIDETELQRGLFNHAAYHVFVMNHQDPSQGVLKMITGKFGEVSVLSVGIFVAELRGLMQLMRQSIVRSYKKDCDTDLGNPATCKIPIYPDEVERLRGYSLGDHVRATNTSPFGSALLTTGSNLGFESGLTGWTTNSGTPTTATSKQGTSAVEGSNFLTGTDSLGSWEVEQVVSLTTDMTTAKIDSGDYLLHFSVRVASAQGLAEGADDHTVKVEFLDASDVLVSTPLNLAAQKMGADNDGWGYVEFVNELVPVNARKVRVTLGGVEVSGNTASTCFDDVRVSFTDQTDATLLRSYASAANPRLEVGGLEEGVIGWNEESGDWRAVVLNGSATPLYGGFMIRGFHGGTGTLSQVFAVDDVFSGADIDAGDVRMILTAAVETEDTADTYRFEVEALDAAGVAIRHLRDTGTKTLAAADTWEDLSLDLVLPSGTRSVRVSFTSTLAGGITNNVAFDLDFIVLEHLGRALDSTNFADRIYECTVAGTTAQYQPTYDTVVGNTTVDGSATFTAREAWSRAIEVISVDGLAPRRKFTVTELTPNSGGTTAGRDHFPDDSMNGGVVTWETGANAGTSMEVKDFVADDGITIEQDVELWLATRFDVAIGDKARIHRGCDKRRATCRDVFGNVVNLRGFPDVPGEDFLNDYPDSKVPVVNVAR